MRYVEKLHLDKYSVKNTVKTETMAIQLAEIYVRYRYGERIAEEEKTIFNYGNYQIVGLLREQSYLMKVAGGVFIIRN